MSYVLATVFFKILSTAISTIYGGVIGFDALLAVGIFYGYSQYRLDRILPNLVYATVALVYNSHLKPLSSLVDENMIFVFEQQLVFIVIGIFLWHRCSTRAYLDHTLAKHEFLNKQSIARISLDC